MKYDPDKGFIRHLKWAKRVNDHMALAFMLGDYIEKTKGISKKSFKAFEEFQKTPEYKKLLIKSVRRFREMIRLYERWIKKYGFYSSKGYVDEDYYKERKTELKYMEKEAKRLKLSI